MEGTNGAGTAEPQEPQDVAGAQPADGQGQQQQPPQDQPADTQGQRQQPQQDQRPKAGPDESQKMARIERERDEWRTKYEALAKDGAKGDGSREAELEAELERVRKLAAIDVELASRGCRSLAMAHAAIDLGSVTLGGKGLEGFDAAAFADENPFLFEAPKAATVSTGAPQTGPAPDGPAKTIREALEKTKESRKGK